MVSVRVSTKRRQYFPTCTKNAKNVIVLSATNLVPEHMDMLMQDEHNSPPLNSIIGKKSNEKAHKNSYLK